MSQWQGNWRDELYFVGNKKGGLVKIGVTRDMNKRITSLECGCGAPLDILSVTRGFGGFETPLHYLFDDLRQMGEWFTCSPELLKLASFPRKIPSHLDQNIARIAIGGASFARRLGCEKKRALESRVAAAANSRPRDFNPAAANALAIRVRRAVAADLAWDNRPVSDIDKWMIRVATSPSSSALSWQSYGDVLRKAEIARALSANA